MRLFFAALALAGALFPFTAAQASEPTVQLAQMARDVTDAVRKQREEQRERSRADERQRRGSKDAPSIVGTVIKAVARKR